MSALGYRLTDQQRDILLGAIDETWQAIGGDVLAAWRSCKQRPTNILAIEATIDANHMSMYAADGKEAERIVTAMVAAGSYGGTLRRIARMLAEQGRALA